jgi:hypothetical protein
LFWLRKCPSNERASLLKLTRRDLMTGTLAAAGMVGARAGAGPPSTHRRLPPKRLETFRFEPDGRMGLSRGAQRAIDIAVEFGLKFTHEEGLMVANEGNLSSINGRQSYLCGLAFLCSGKPDLVQRGRDILRHLGKGGYGHYSVLTGLIALDEGIPLFNKEEMANFREQIENSSGGGEMIIAGRNINIPMGAWMGWIVGAAANKDEAKLQEGIKALEKLTDLVAAHGEIPEYNSSTYHPLTLMYLRGICLADEPRTKRLASALEEHIWASLAWRWHPRLGQPCGPWGRAYHDSLIGASGMTHLLGGVAWGGMYDPEPGYRTLHAHDNPFGPLLVLLVKNLPFDTSHIVRNKPLPITVVSRAEQAVVRLGRGPHLTWVPGGIAELTTWMDENLAVGSASRNHIHGMQNGTYLAQWTRTGDPVRRLNDLGQAFTHFTQNGRRPLQEQYIYHNHHGGGDLVTGPYQWADDGRHGSLQSGPTTMTVYVPKGQERWDVKRLELFMSFPRLDTIDDVLVDSKSVRLPYEGSPDGAVAVLSGKAVMGMRFTACKWAGWLDWDPAEPMTPRLVIEEANDHLLVGVRLVDYPEPRELTEATYRRYAASVGSTLAFLPDRADLGAFLKDLSEAEIEDVWDMDAWGGHREVRFRLGSTELYGRFEPISESWLRRRASPPEGAVHFTEWGKNTLES